MPGLSFLFKKRFHPSRLDNQKRIFIAEEKQAEKNEREVESAKEVMKEKEMQHYEQCGSMDFRDPRTSALKFMYATPMAKDDEKDGKNTKKMASVMDYESKIDHKTGDDEMVRAFRAKIVQTKLKSLSESLVQQKTVGEEGAQYEVEVPANQSEHTESRSSKRKAAPAVSALEKEVGKRRTELTHDQMQERFAVLKNAPMEGGYAKGMAVKHKPFNELLRNVHCARCGEWGHMSGERECPLRDYNPLDYARQQREDPMRKMMDAPVPASSSSAAHPSCAADRHSRSGQSHTDSSTRGSARDSNTSSGVQGHRSSSRYVDEAGESDPEAEFLASLTRREKMLLLRKLQVIENGGVDATESKRDNESSSGESSDDSSTSSSSSSSSSSSDSSESESHHGKHKRKHSKRSHKHSRKGARTEKHRGGEKKEGKRSRDEKKKRRRSD